MRLDCDQAREWLDAWALGALDADDLRAVTSHLANCGDCAAAAAEAREAAASVALAVPLHSSSAALKSRVMASARVLTDIRRTGISRWWRAAAGTAAAVAIATAAWASVMQLRAGDLREDRRALADSATAQAGELQALRAELVSTSTEADRLDETVEMQTQVLDVVLRPGLEWTQMDGTPAAPAAKGLCAWSRTEAFGALLADDLPASPRGRHYTFWLVYESEWVNGGAFTVDEDGRGLLLIKKVWGQRDIGRFLGYAVTLEDAGGRDPGPRGELVLSSAMR